MARPAFSLGPWKWCCAAPAFSPGDELLAPAEPFDRVPLRGAASQEEPPAEAAVVRSHSEEPPELELDVGALSPKVGEVATELIWDGRKPEVVEEEAPPGPADADGHLSLRDIRFGGLEMSTEENEAEKPGKALSLCSTRVDDSSHASSSKKSSLCTAGSQFSECVDIAPPTPDKAQMTPMGILLGMPNFGPEDGRAGPAVAAVRSLTRSGRAARKLSRHFAERVHWRRSTLLRSAARRAAGGLVPAEKPLFSVLVRGVTVERMRVALERTEGCPLIRFLEEVFLCSDIGTSEWMYTSDGCNAKIRQTSYSMPVPRDIPEVAVRLLRVPPVIKGTTVWRMHTDPSQLVLVQHSQTKDVLYGDRFKLQNTISIVEEPTGVSVSTWTDVVWLSPLPWTHGVIKHVIEKKAKSDSAAVVGQLVQMMEEAAWED